MAVYRAWQAVLSVLALGSFFALEYVRDTSVPSIALVILSWVAIVAPFLLAVSWVAKKQYIRTLVLAILVAATRLSLEDTLSKFMKTAAWFLIGATVLAVVVTVAMRWWRRGKTQKRGIVAQAGDLKTATSPAQDRAVQEPAPDSVAARDADTLEPAEPTAEAPTGAEYLLEVTPVPYCDKCGATITDDTASFCRKCGAPLA